jgi:hypothetical protein
VENEFIQRCPFFFILRAILQPVNFRKFRVGGGVSKFHTPRHVILPPAGCNQSDWQFLFSMKQ